MGLASKVCTLVASWTWLKECPSNAAKSVSGRRASAHDFRRAFVERMQAQGMPDSLLPHPRDAAQSPALALRAHARRTGALAPGAGDGGAAVARVPTGWLPRRRRVADAAHHGRRPPEARRSQPIRSTVALVPAGAHAGTSNGSASCANRRTAASHHRSSTSTPIALRPRLAATRSVVPAPMNGSSTRSPGCE